MTKTISHKIVLFLHRLKAYPTFDNLATEFGFSKWKGNVHMEIQKLKEVFIRVLQKKGHCQLLVKKILESCLKMMRDSEIK